MRDLQGLRQSDLAEAVGITASCWSRVERGESALTVDQLRRAASVLEVSVSEIFQNVDKAESALAAKGIRVWDTKNVPGEAIPVIGTVLTKMIAEVLGAG